jgi:hypothetical protein
MCAKSPEKRYKIEKLEKIYKTKLGAHMDFLDYELEQLKYGQVFSLGYAMRELLRRLLGSSKDEGWDFEWGSSADSMRTRAREFYYDIADHINKSKPAFVNSAENFTNKHSGFIIERNGKRYLYFIEGKFSSIFKKYAETRRGIFDFWIDELEIGNIRHNRENQRYLSRESVGKNKPQQRKWFYVFCLTDFENKYP